MIDSDPVGGAKLDLKRHAKPIEGPRRGGRALSEDEQERVIAHLLTVAPESLVTSNRGPGGRAMQIAKRRNTIDLTLLQAGTGLRISEALQITIDNVESDDDGRMFVRAEITKTGFPRRIPGLDGRIQEHIQARVDDVPGPWLIGAPADPAKQWRKDGNGGAGGPMRDLYVDLARELDVPLMEHARAHLWRTTLSRRLRDAGVDPSNIADVMGHDEVTNKASYTDRTDTSALVAAFRRRYR